MISDKFKNPKTPYSGASCNNIASDTCDPKQNALSTFPAVRRWSISILLLVAICAQTMPTHAMPTAKSLVEQTGSSESGQTPSAPSSDYRIFIPQASKNTPSQALGAGAQIIEAAGKVDVTMELKEPESQPHPEVVLPPLNTSGTVKCDPMHYTGDEVYNTVDQFILNPNVGLIYPGSIVQSRDLMQGVFTPVTIPTGSGEITLSGPVFSGNNSSRDVPTIDYRHTYGAIQDILKDTVVGTPAEIKTVLKTASSKEEMFFEAGLDARYSQFSAAGNVMSKNTNSRSQAFLMYVQSYYDVSIKDPERSFSFFRDGGNFTDPDGQIRSGNPPMYVQSVTYGRVFILSVARRMPARSSSSTKAVISACSSAVPWSRCISSASAPRTTRPRPRPPTSPWT